MFLSHSDVDAAQKKILYTPPTANTEQPTHFITAVESLKPSLIFNRRSGFRFGQQ